MTILLRPFSVAAAEPPSRTPKGQGGGKDGHGTAARERGNFHGVFSRRGGGRIAHEAVPGKGAALEALGPAGGKVAEAADGGAAFVQDRHGQ